MNKKMDRRVERRAKLFRVEIKYPLTREQLYAFRVWHKKNGLLFKKQYPDRMVHSIYFDDVDLKDYGKNVEGMAQRKKVRIRWYGGEREEVRARLEIKKRINTVNSKEVQDLGDKKLRIEPLGSLWARVRERLEAEMRNQAQGILFPAIYNRYQREYYTAHANIRMTVDTDMRFEKLFFKRQRSNHLLASRMAAVLEVKYPREVNRDISRVFPSFPFRNTRNSKYANAISDY